MINDNSSIMFDISAPFIDTNASINNKLSPRGGSIKSAKKPLDNIKTIDYMSKLALYEDNGVSMANLIHLRHDSQSIKGNPFESKSALFPSIISGRKPNYQS